MRLRESFYLCLKHIGQGLIVPCCSKVLMLASSLLFPAEDSKKSFKISS